MVDTASSEYSPFTWIRYAWQLPCVGVKMDGEWICSRLHYQQRGDSNSANGDSITMPSCISPFLYQVLLRLGKRYRKRISVPSLPERASL